MRVVRDAPSSSRPTSANPTSAAPKKTGPVSRKRPWPADHRAGAADGEQIQQLNEELTSLKLTVAELEKERDFYFGKLRDIEITCQVRRRRKRRRL
eukprot:306151-Hanusia_phi.AAC.3